MGAPTSSCHSPWEEAIQWPEALTLIVLKDPVKTVSGAPSSSDDLHVRGSEPAPWLTILRCLYHCPRAMALATNTVAVI